MDNIIQVKKIRYAKMCRESTLLHGLIKKLLSWKKWKPETTRVTAYPSPPVFFSEAPPPPHPTPHPTKLFSILETSCSRTSQNSIGKTAVDFCFSSGHRPSYLLNSVACCPWNFEAVISRNIFYWLIAVIKSSQQRCSIKKLFLKILQYSQKNTFAGALWPTTLFKRDSNTGVFLWISRKF